MRNRLPLALLASAAMGQSPYPPSPAIGGMSFDWGTHKRDAQGSDNWQLTWAADGHQYAAWGDGGGFGGTNSDGRVSLGVARVEGGWESCKGVNVWGGKNALHPATFQGKSWGMISVGGVLYMWVAPGSPLEVMQREARIHRSRDYGATWEPADWAFRHDDRLTIPTICQFGKDYAGARWSKDGERRKPTFEDAAGVGWVMSVSLNAGLKRYILMTDHETSNRGNLGVFDAPEPWGPWTTVLYLRESEGTNFGNGHVEPNTFFWNLPVKWQSRDGLDFTMVFTGSGRGKNNDSFNLVRGKFTSRADRSRARRPRSRSSL